MLSFFSGTPLSVLVLAVCVYFTHDHRMLRDMIRRSGQKDQIISVSVCFSFKTQNKNVKI